VDADARISIPQFVEQPDGEQVIIANMERSCFLAVPHEAVTLLRLLAAGNTVGEACAGYERMYGTTPDIDDFVEALTSQGFIAAPDRSRGAVSSPRSYHFDNISTSIARRICSLPVLAGCGVVVAMAVAACVIDPSVLPPPTTLVFQHDTLGMTVLVIAITLVTLFLHEFSHLLAARAAGVPSRMGLGNRLWILVAETDMTGMWLASARQRCIAFLAGPLFDLVMSAILVLALFGYERGWIGLDETVLGLVRATLFIGLTRLLWQLYFFLPTDVYYVFGTLCRCRNLMHDTQVYLLNQLARALHRRQSYDQSGIPASEMRVVRWFALVWIVGRALAFVTLFAITLPVLVGYAALLARALTGDSQAFGPLINGPGLPLLAVMLQTTGILVWLRGAFRARGAI
jgi:putative peptide zinc metalloprotease protein